jgi:membrane protease YdiL (CAAX protease family)
MQQARSDVWLYALAVLGLTTLIAAGFWSFDVTNNWAANALMFVPGLMAVIFLVKGTERFRTVGWGFGRPIDWFWAILLPTILVGVSLSISVGLGYATRAPGSSAIAALPPLKILFNMILYTLLSIPFAFGEELGWRGYAQGRLIREFGLLLGLLLLGIIWGFWHSPIFYVMGTFPDHPVLGPFVMTPIDNVLVVVPMWWLYVRSNSIWVPTFTHALGDVLGGFSGLLFPATREIHSWAVLQSVQLIISIALLVDLKSRPTRDVP